MRFLIDQDVYALTTRLLKVLGHDVITAAERGKATASDEDLLAIAYAEGRILITRDKDFGALVFLGRAAVSGVVLMRGSPSELNKVHGILQQLLGEQPESVLLASLCVVESERYRIRRIL